MSRELAPCTPKPPPRLRGERASELANRWPTTLGVGWRLCRGRRLDQGFLGVHQRVDLLPQFQILLEDVPQRRLVLLLFRLLAHLQLFLVARPQVEALGGARRLLG